MIPLGVGVLFTGKCFFFLFLGLSFFLGVNLFLGGYLDGTDAGGFLTQEGALAAAGVLKGTAAVDILAAVGARAYLAVIGEGRQFLAFNVIQTERHAAVVALASTLEVIEETEV